MVVKVEWKRKMEDEYMVVLEGEDYEHRVHKCYIFHYGYIYFIVVYPKGGRQVFNEYEYRISFPKYYQELMEKLEIEGVQTAGEATIICE